MRSGKLFSLTSIFILFCSIAFAQATSTTLQPSDTSSETDAAKKKKELDEGIMQMLDRAVADGNALRLSQNKALIYAIAGDLYWKFDEKRARELFRSAASEIITYNTETEKEQAQQNKACAVVFSRQIRTTRGPRFCLLSRRMTPSLLIRCCSRHGRRHSRWLCSRPRSPAPRLTPAAAAMAGVRGAARPTSTA